MNNLFDLIVIGGGPAGYVAAIRASQLGFKVACIEKNSTWGGTCLNVGCIPSKALLDSSERYFYAQKKLKKHGILIDQVTLDLNQMMQRKASVVNQLVRGVATLLKKNQVQTFQGQAHLTPSSSSMHIVKVDLSSGGQHSLSAPRILLATGSEPNPLEFLPFDGKNILSSTDALSLTQVPKHLCVVGGGVIGLELGSVWQRLGAQVTVIEFQDQLCPAFDQQVTHTLQQSLSRQGILFQLSTECTGFTASNSSLLLHTKHRKTGVPTTLECDKILVATGRRPYTAGLHLEQAGLKPNAQGRLDVNERYETQVSGIYAVGDLIQGPMLAHKAEEEGIAAVEIMANQAGHVNYQAIPNVIYTWPEVACVGWTEEELKKKNQSYQKGSFPFLANGRAQAMDETEGFIKILSETKTDRLLGVHIIGPWASDLIQEAVSVIEFGGSAEDIARSCHAHPTLSEALKEAALAVAKRAIHN